MAGPTSVAGSMPWPDPQRAGAGDEPLDERVVDGRLDDDAAGGRALLSGRGERAVDGVARRRDRGRRRRARRSGSCRPSRAARAGAAARPGRRAARPPRTSR